MTGGVTLVTGASGFLGHHICRTLVDQGAEVVGLVRRPDSTPAGVVPRLCSDLLDRAALAAALDGVDQVIHLAARVHLTGDTALAEYRRTNVEGTQALLQESLNAGVRRFVFVSSVKAVGEGNESPWTEQTHEAPCDPYGMSKLEGERVIRELAWQRGMHAPILRLPMVYGPGMRANMLRLFQLVDREIPLPLGSVRNRRSLVFSDNVVAAVASVLGTPAAAQEIFFVRDDRDLSTPELVRAVAQALGRRSRLVRVPVPMIRAAGRVGDLLSRVIHSPIDSAMVERLVGSLCIDASKLGRVTGYRPPVAVDEGLRRTATWYLARGASRN